MHRSTTIRRVPVEEVVLYVPTSTGIPLELLCFGHGNLDTMTLFPFFLPPYRPPCC